MHNTEDGSPRQQEAKTMEDKKMLRFIKEVLANRPSDWLKLTTHRLDIYDEALAKTQFLEKLGMLYKANDTSSLALAALPTAYDYIRLGHPLSCVLEWTVAQLNDVPANNVISFSSTTMPVLAVLRRNLLDKKHTRILHTEELPACFDADVLRQVYGYAFEVQRIERTAEIPAFNGSTILVSQQEAFGKVDRKLLA